MGSNQETSKLEINWKRTRTFFLWGAVFIAPLLHVAYAKVFPYLIPEMTTIAALKKVSLDQFIVAPFIMLVFYPFTAFFNGRPMNEARSEEHTYELQSP